MCHFSEKASGRCAAPVGTTGATKIKQIHDDLDAAVFDAYGWPVSLSDEEILERLVALNAERTREEERGLVRWLRPEFQNPSGSRATQQTIDSRLRGNDETDAEPEETPEKPVTKTTAARKQPWPKSLSEQAQALRAALAAETKPVTPTDIARRFQRAPIARVTELLETLCTLGQAHRTRTGRYTV